MSFVRCGGGASGTGRGNGRCGLWKGKGRRRGEKEEDERSIYTSERCKRRGVVLHICVICSGRYLSGVYIHHGTK